MKEILFEKKEDYLKLKQNWAIYFNKEARHLITDDYGWKQVKLEPSHFMIYAIIRGKDPMIPISGCSEETLEQCKLCLQSYGGRFYTRQIFNEIFGLNKEQIGLIKLQAAKLKFNKVPEIIKQKRVPITEDVLISCLA